MTIQAEEKKEKCIKKSEESQYELCTPSNKVLFALWEAQKRKRKRCKLIKEIMAKYFPQLGKRYGHPGT